MLKTKTKKQKLSECCQTKMIGGVQCENCGSNGKFTPTTAVVRKLSEMIGLMKENAEIINKPSKLFNPEKKDERFIDNNDGTISDTKTGYMWQKEGSKERIAWKDTEDYCKKSSVGGHNDWRMPTVEELFSIIDYTRREPAINPIFKCESAGYWSATKYVYAAAPGNLAWYVDFIDGYVSNYDRNNFYYVRPVRQYSR